MENKKNLKKGDPIKVHTLETVVEDIVTIGEFTMVSTRYGDFNIDIVEKIEKNERIN